MVAVGTVGVLGKAAMKVGTAAVGALKDITMQSVEAYASQQQLVGGIQTLYGDFADDVLVNARKSFQTTGQSMNEYMETVIEGSASLIKSLNGDQAAASKLIDQSLQDMADNVNKMGTSMEGLRNAYRGFSRGNFTMLDNLALGYSGTKEGMLDLLKTAEEIQAKQGHIVKYSIDSYADIIDAVHVVQTEMGITGTTAEEAKETISGSAASMKAAWQNLVAGLADSNADLDTLINELLSSVGTMADNVVPRITAVFETLKDNIPKWIEKLGDELSVPENIENLTVALSTLFRDAFEAIGKNGVRIGSNIATLLSETLHVFVESDTGELRDAVSGIIEGIVNLLTNADLLQNIVWAGNNIIWALMTGIGESLPTITPQIIEAILFIAEKILDDLPYLIDAGLTLFTGLAEGLTKAIPIIAEKLPEIIIKIVDVLTDEENMTHIIDAGIAILFALIDGIIETIPVLIEKVPEILRKLKEAFEENQPKIQAMGMYIVAEIISGLAERWPDLKREAEEKLLELKDKAVDYIEEKFKELGEKIVNGIKDGISDKWRELKRNFESKISGLISGAKSILGIHSPSRVFRDEIGAQMAAGIGEGFIDNLPIDDMQNALDASNFSSPITGSIGNDREIVLNIDGHELARFLAPAMNSQLAFGRV